MNFDDYKAWPFQEARQILKQRQPKSERPVIFQTGFGPSGLPHIGTFAEVARTTWVRQAFEVMTGLPTHLQAFSDDMDGLRKVPLNLPQSEMLAGHLGKPLHAVPDPFGEVGSFSEYMNRRLCEFLDTYGFDYAFQSSKEAYRRGDFDEGLSILLEKVEAVRDLILPTLREETRLHWSPFMPICPACGSVYATRVTAYCRTRNSLDYVCDGRVGMAGGCGAGGEISVLGGGVKVGWKVDWALRWFTYEVDYEMYGKDLIDSARLSARIVRLMGRQPPAGLTYELFLDQDGHKISKSVGRGLSVNAWVQFAPIESLLFHIYQNPKRARRLYWDVVPKCVDDYVEALCRYVQIAEEKKPDQDLWHIGNAGSEVAAYDGQVNFSAVNNLISALGSDSETLLFEYLSRYDSAVHDNVDFVKALIDKGLNYYRELVLPTKKFRQPSDDERLLLRRLHDRLAATADGDEASLQAIPFDVARSAGREPKDLFRTFYEIVLGQERGPRFGSFVSLVGRERILELLAEKVA